MSTVLKKVLKVPKKHSNINKYKERRNPVIAPTNENPTVSINS